MAEDEACIKRQHSVANTDLGAKPKKRAKKQEQAASGEEETSDGARAPAAEVDEEKREEFDKKTSTPRWRKPQPYKSKEAMCQEDFDKKTTKVHWKQAQKMKKKRGPQKKEGVEKMPPSGKVG